MRMIRARHVMVASVLLVLAGCKSGGTAGSSWWNSSPFKSTTATPTSPTNPYPPKPSQLYANSATSSPSSGISGGGTTNSSASGSPSVGSSTGNRSLSSVTGNTRSSSTFSTSPSQTIASAGARGSGTTSSAGSSGASYPATRASYTAPGAGTPARESTATSAAAGPMGSSTATDVVAPQRGYYSIPSGAAATNNSQNTGAGTYSGLGPSGSPARSETPFRSPSTATPRFDTPSNRYGNSGVKDPFVSPSQHSAGPTPGGTQGFYPLTPGSTSQGGRSGGTSYGPPNGSNIAPSAPSGWNYPGDPQFSAPDGAGHPGAAIGPYSAPSATADRVSAPNYGSAPADARSASTGLPNPGTEYRPGSTGYQPPASDYRPGQTGYTPPSPGTGYAWPQTGSSYGSPSANGAPPFRYPSASPSGGGITPEDAPYRPGSVTEYPSRASSQPAGSTPATVSNPWVTPNSSGNSGLRQ